MYICVCVRLPRGCGESDQQGLEHIPGIDEYVLTREYYVDERQDDETVYEKTHEHGEHVV